MERKYLLLSADGDISLYEVAREIHDNLDALVNHFYRWKTTYCFDETLFVTFLIGKYGNDAVRFIKVVGTCSGEKSLKSGKVEDDIEEAYRNVNGIIFKGKEVDFWTDQISMNGAASGFQVTALFDCFGA